MEVLGAITAIIGLIDAIDRAYTAIDKIKGLPKAFETVKRHLPAVQKGLQEVRAKREENESQVIDADKGLEGILKNCETNVRALQAIFDELQARCNELGGSEWVWKDRCKDLYKRVLQGSKARRVENLMVEIWGDVKHLALTEIIGLRSYVSYVVDDKIQELEKVEPSLEDRELDGVGLHANQNIATGGTGTQTNVEGDHNIVNSGHLTGEFAGGHFENFHYGDKHNHYHSDNPRPPSVESQRVDFLYKLRGMEYDARLRTIQRPLDGTCQWFLQHPSFRAWLQNKKGLLLVSADAGCGKSVLAKYLIEKVLKEEDPAQTICYFFFKDDETQARSFTNASKALLHQLLEDKGALIDRPVQVSKQGEEETILDRCMELLSPQVDRISDFRRIWSAFEFVSIKPGVGPVTCVLDALDESDYSQRRDFLKRLRKYLHGHDELLRAKFIVTTRGYPQILHEFNKFATGKIHLDGDSDEEKIQIQKEISIVMNYRLNELKSRIPGISESTLDIIRAGLAQRGAEQKTYLWMHLMFELFERRRSSDRSKWREVFEKPPRTIASAYEKLLSWVEDDSRADVRILLALIIAAERPLTITELSAAVSARRNTKLKGCFDMSDMLEDDEFKNWIRWECGSFVTIHASKAYLIHQTAREFLLAECDVEIGRGHWGKSISERDAHRYMAESCVSWLSHDRFQNAQFFLEVQTYIWKRMSGRSHYDSTFEHDSSTFQQPHDMSGFPCPFFSYASKHWLHHFKRCQRRLPNTHEVQDIEPEFAVKYEILFTLRDFEDPYRFYTGRNGEGLDSQPTETRAIISEALADRLYSTHLSSFNLEKLEHEKCSERMKCYQNIEMDKRVTRDFQNIRTRAERLNWEASINCLLNSVYILNRDSSDHRETREPTIHRQDILPDIMARERNQAWYCLMSYENQRYGSLEEYWIAKSIPQRAPHYWNVARDACLLDHRRLLVLSMHYLFRASDEADELTVWISEHDAFALYSLVHVASQQGSNLCLEYLCRKGFDINLKNPEGQVPLHKAAGNGHDQSVAILLDFGASDTILDNHHRTPFTYAMTTETDSPFIANHLASIRKHRGQMRSLLYFAAIAEKPNEEHTWQELELIKKRYSLMGMKLLLTRGSSIDLLRSVHANFQFRYRKNLTALHISVKKAGRLHNTFSLLRGKADVHATDDFGNNPFHVATWYGNMRGLQALLAYGADVNCCGQNGDTPLHITCRNGNVDVAKFLLRKGADPGIRNSQNLTVFELNNILGLLNMEELLQEQDRSYMGRNFGGEMIQDHGSKETTDLSVALIGFGGGMYGAPWVDS